MGDHLPPLPDLPNAQRWTTALVLEYARSYAEEAVKQEREAIAAMCQATQHEYYDAGGSLLLNTPQRLAAAIRARSEQGSRDV